MNSENLMLAQQQLAKKSTVWLLFIFFGWSYGSLGNIGLQVLFYLTAGGLGLWALIRLFTLNGAINEYNRTIARNLGISQSDLIKLGIT